jgi:peroxiredoxin Q/BCP
VNCVVRARFGANAPANAADASIGTMASHGDELAPDFTLPSTSGEIHLAERVAANNVLLVFYPGDDTPVCTNQLCDYRDNLAAFSQLDVDVLGINTQGLESHERFASKHALPFPLLADTDKQVCRSYGAIGLLGTTKRMLVLVDRNRRIRWRCTDLPIFRRTAEEIREAIEELDL